MVLYCIKNSKTIDKLTAQEFKSFSDLFDDDILDAVKLKNMINGRNIRGGTAFAEVKRQIKEIRKKAAAINV
jgi:argininosuccinate lyase